MKEIIKIRSSIAAPSIGYELERYEMDYVDSGDFFIGINFSAVLGSCTI